MNAYQKITILLASALLPLVLLFMSAMGYVGVWIVGVVGFVVSIIVLYAVRNAPEEH